MARRLLSRSLPLQCTYLLTIFVPRVQPANRVSLLSVSLSAMLVSWLCRNRQGHTSFCSPALAAVFAIVSRK
jgi:hypothetical protein